MLSFEGEAILERVTIPILFLYFLGMLWLCCFSCSLVFLSSRYRSSSVFVCYTFQVRFLLVEVFDIEKLAGFTNTYGIEY